MKFLKLFLFSFICVLLQLTASVDSNFPENSKITQYLPLPSTSYLDVNGVQKETELALNLVQNLIKLKTQYANLRAAIIIAINNGLVEKLTRDNIAFSNIKKIDTEIELGSKMQEALEKCVLAIFSFKPKDDKTFIDLINGMISKIKDNKDKIFEALNIFLNIYESIVYDVCVNIQDGKLDAQSILNMQDVGQAYVLRFILSSQAKSVTQQSDFVNKYLKYLSEQVQEEQSAQVGQILDVYKPDTVTLYFNTNSGQDGYAQKDSLAIKTPSKLIKELGKNSLRAQIIKAINNIIYEHRNKFSDLIQNGLPKVTVKKNSIRKSFIGEIAEEVDENDLLDGILNSDTLNIGFLVSMLNGTTKDTLMPQVWDANKALSGLERIIYIICKELSDKVVLDDIIKKYLDENAQVIMGPIIKKFGSGDDLEDDKSEVGPFGQLFDFYLEKCSDKLDSLKSDTTGIAALEEQEVKAAQLAAAELAAKLEAEKKQQEAKLAAELAAQAAKAQAKPTPKPRLPRIDVFINCSTTLSVLQ